MVSISEVLARRRDAGVIAVGRKAIGDDPVAPLGFDKRFDHAVFKRLRADPFVGENRHSQVIPDAGHTSKCQRAIIRISLRRAADPASVYAELSNPRDK